MAASSVDCASAPQPVAGVRLAAAAAGLRYRDRDDIALIEIAAGSSFACAYTRNRFCAAPVVVARRHQLQQAPRYLVINAGNANAGTGVAGEHAAVEVCAAIAAAGDCPVEAVLPYSTGVIGEALDAPCLAACAPALINNLNVDGWTAAAAAILTTDTQPKVRSVRVAVGDVTMTVTGMCKGSGMIRPDMATMLAYVATDMAIAQPLLEHMIGAITDVSFNAITVDGDTSTNDAFALIATGSAGAVELTSTDDPRYPVVLATIEAVAAELARDIVRDGEGATRFVTVRVHGAATVADCREVAYTVAHSPLVKTALFAGDPNWGRILAAIGRAPVPGLDIDQVAISIGPVDIVSGGQPVAGYDETSAAQVMAAPEFDITIGLGSGGAEFTVWTCDFSYDYVKINAEYRS